MFIGLDKGHFLSHTGQCKPFDALADGYSRSEGCGLFVLKRLSDAVDENDRILGIIRGVEVNQSGTASSITRPDVDSQQALFLRLMANAGIDPRRVSVVEAHGTGTQVGDVSEMESIRRVFGSASRKAKNPLHVTSVKANIGHLEAASGSASLAKLLLMFRHRTIPKLISVEQLNPLFRQLDGDGIVLDREMKPWQRSEVDDEEKPRIAVLNNFGAAGSNSTLLLEEYESDCTIQETEDRLPFVLAISGKTMGAVEALRAQYIKFLNVPQTKGTSLYDIAYTATARRQVYECRLAVSGSTTSELVEKLKKSPAVPTQSASIANVIFVFSGQGNQYFGMGSQLYKTCPSFKCHIDECQSTLVSLGFRGMLDVILGKDGNGRSIRMEEQEAGQIAVFSLEYALSQLWMSWGVEPVAVVGHRYGTPPLPLTTNINCVPKSRRICSTRHRRRPFSSKRLVFRRKSSSAYDKQMCSR
jgi:acyl transferase domain-containing protein